MKGFIGCAYYSILGTKSWYILIGFNVREYEPYEPVRWHEAGRSNHERKGVYEEEGIQEEKNRLKEAVHDWVDIVVNAIPVNKQGDWTSGKKWTPPPLVILSIEMKVSEQYR